MVPEANQLVIKPFAATDAGAIEKAILKSELGITPQNDGKVIRLTIPPLSEQRRKHGPNGVCKTFRFYGMHGYGSYSG